MFRIQFFCPLQSMNWQDYEETVFFLFRRPIVFSTFAGAQRAAVALVFQYHSIRVLNPKNEVVFQI